jgi:hypothetical protein
MRQRGRRPVHAGRPFFRKQYNLRYISFVIISRPFFQNMIEPAQQKAADEARARIVSELGTYDTLRKYALKPEAAPDEISLRRGRNMGSFTIDLQWVLMAVQKRAKMATRAGAAVRPPLC